MMFRIKRLIKDVLLKIIDRNKILKYLFVRLRLIKCTQKIGHKKNYMVISPKKDYCIYCGILSLATEVLELANEAKKAGYVPVADLRWLIGESGFFPIEEYGKGDNPWEHFFKQLDGESRLEEALRDPKTRILKMGLNYIDRMNPYDVFNYSSDKVKYWSRFVCENLQLSNRLKERVEKIYGTLFVKEDRVLGCAIRAGHKAGEMKKSKTHNGHPVVGDCYEYIDNVKKRFKDWDCSKIFIMVDDREYMESFKKAFGELLIYIDRPLTHYFKNGVSIIGEEEADIEKKNYTVKENMEDYLVEVYILSRCHYLYCSQGTGQAFSYLLNGGQYKHVEVDMRGVYKF